MRNDRLLVSGSLAVVRVATIAGSLFLAAVCGGLIASAVMPGRFTTMLLGSSADTDAGTTGVRLLLAVGLIMAFAILALLRSLGEMIVSVRSGDPFDTANVRRLRWIGWSLLTLQLLDVPCALITRFYPSLGKAAPNGGISLGGWIAVLMVFVLAQIFSTGAAMRDDLAGTI